MKRIAKTTSENVGSRQLLVVGSPKERLPLIRKSICIIVGTDKSSGLYLPCKNKYLPESVKWDPKPLDNRGDRRSRTQEEPPGRVSNFLAL